MSSPGYQGTPLVNGAFPFLTQTAWAVNIATGNDAGPGTPAQPLRTIAELVRRTWARTFAPTVATVTITIAAGDYTADSELILGFCGCVPGGSLAVNLSGAMTPTGVAGAISAWQPWVTGATRGALTDAAANFTPQKQKRIRMTDGGAQGAVTNYGSVAAATIANVGQFYTTAGALGTLVNPAVNDHYIVEDWATKLRGYHIRCPGCVVTVSDVSYEIAGVGDGEALSGNQFLVRHFGCRFNVPGIVMSLAGNQLLLCCAATGVGAVQTVTGFQSWKGCNVFSSQPIVHALGSAIQAQATMHDGDGARNAGLRIIDNSELADIGQSRFFGGIINGTIAALARVNGQSWYIEGTAQVWGAAGNTTTTAVQVLNGSGVSYDIKPTCTGVAPGVNDVTLSGVPMAWAAVPAIAAAPNNAYVNTRV